MRNLIIFVTTMCLFQSALASKPGNFVYFFNGAGTQAVINIKTGKMVIGGHDSMRVQSCSNRNIKICFEIPFLEIEIAVPNNLKSTASWRGSKYLHCRRQALRVGTKEEVFYVESGTGENCLNLHKKSAFLFSTSRGVTMFERVEKKSGATFLLIENIGLGST